MIAREPTSRSPSMRMPGTVRAAVAQRADEHLAQRQQVDAVVVDRLEPQRGFHGGARMRAGQHVELGSRRGHRRAEHNGRRCCSSSTSATPRPTSAPSAARSWSSTGALRPCAQSTADELGAALRNLLELRGYGFERPRRARSSPRPCPSSSPSGRRWPSRYLGHEMLVVGPGHEDGHGDPLRQPARDRRRPARQRGRHPRALRRPGGVRGLRHRDHLRRRLRARASTSAAR